jgi:hypothetical protein
LDIQSYPEQNKQFWRYRNIKLQLYCRDIVIQTAWYKQKVDMKANGIEEKNQTRHMEIQSTDFQQRSSKYALEER